jgi:serine/threonine-protein kinase
MMQDLSGQKLGQYELRERLGRGGMADVYKAFQPSIERFVAVKTMLGHLASDQEFVERFRREARAVGQLRHPHIVTVFDFGIERDIYYMVMEFIKGENLKAYIARHPQGVPIEDALRITSQIADALAYAHRAGLIHRDVKPANIMFSDETYQNAILTDFGIAHIFSQPGLTASGAMIGTPAYLSPEIASGREVDERADIYGLGIILYEMLTGRVPFEADTPAAVIMKHVLAPLPSPASFGRVLPDDVEAIILKAMMKDPDDRYQTAAELKAAVDQARARLAETTDWREYTEKIAVETRPVRAPAPVEETPTTLYRKAPAGGRPPWLWVGLGAAVVVVIVAALALLNGGQPPAVPAGTLTEAPTAVIAVATAEPTEGPPPTFTSEPPTPTFTSEPPTATATLTTEPPTATQPPTTVPTTAVPPTAIPATAVPATAVAALPAEFAAFREAGYLSGLTPLQDEIDSLVLADQYEAAENRLNTILRAEPQNIDALTARALLRIQAGETRAGLADADYAIELRPDSPLGYLARSDALRALDDPEGALAAAQQALEVSPDHPEALWRVSWLYDQLGDWETFVIYLDRAEAAGARGFRFAHFAGEYLYYRGEYERALPYLEIWHQTALGDAYATAFLAANLIQLDQPQRADAVMRSYTGDPGLDEWPVWMAYVAYRAEDYIRARTWANRALRRDPDSPGAHYVRALGSWYGGGNLNESMEHFRALENAGDFWDLFLNPDNGHQPDYDRGLILMDAGMLNQAVRAFQRAIDSDPRAYMYEALADAYRAQNNLEAARENLYLAAQAAEDDTEFTRLMERLAELGGETGGIWAEQGMGRREQGDLEGALAAFNHAAELEPDNWWIFFERGITYRDQGDWDAAFADFNHAAELAPEEAIVLVNRAMTYRMMGDTEAALADFARAIELDPDLMDAYFERAITYREQGNVSAALADLNRAAVSGPDAWWVFFQRGILYRDQGQIDAAFADFNHAAELAPEEAIVLVNRAMTYRMMGDTEAALADFARAIELDPDLMDAYFERGVTYLEQSRPAEALPDLNRAVEMAPDAWWVYWGRGLAHHALGNPDAALADWQRLIELNPGFPDVHFEMARIYDERGQSAQALEHYRRYRELGGGEPLAEARITALEQQGGS